MDRAKQIQIGLLGLVAILLLLNLFGGFDGLFGSSSKDASDKARQSLTANATPLASNNNPGTLSATPDGIKPAANNPAANKPVTPPKPTGPLTTIEFEESNFDFGELDQGEKASHTFKFKNTGNEPLIITNAKGNCGCTVPRWPKEPVPPGKSGEIKVEYDSKGKSGAQSKTVTIEGNIPGGRTLLSIKSNVKAPAKPAVQPVQPSK